MKTKTSCIKTIMACVSFCILSLLMSCSKIDQRSNQLLTQENVTKKEIEYLKKRNFLDENEKIIYVYTLTKINTDAILLTNKKILVYNKDFVNKELLADIFDLSTSHSTDKEKTSSITIYRKDDTTLKAEFTGASDADETFFLKLRDLWRMALSEKEGQLPASDTTENTEIR